VKPTCTLVAVALHGLLRVQTVSKLCKARSVDALDRSRLSDSPPGLSAQPTRGVTSWHVTRAVQTRLPASSVITIS
jgi:hypothetical protein